MAETTEMYSQKAAEKLPRTYTRDQLAEILQINPRAVDRLLLAGEIKSFKIGRLRRVSQASLDAFMLKGSDLTEEPNDFMKAGGSNGIKRRAKAAAAKEQEQTKTTEH